MFQRLLSLFSPFHSIADELKSLRELYEADLASRTPPVFRLTEHPSSKDTEVTYMTDEPAKEKSALRRLMEGLPQEDEEEV